jgi:hypothetical protein
MPRVHKEGTKSSNKTKKSNANKTTKQRENPDQRVYTPNVHEKRADSRATILNSGAVELLLSRYGGKWPGKSLALVYYYDAHLSEVVHKVDLKPVDGFTIIKAGEQAIQDRLDEYPELRTAPIVPIPVRDVPTIFKERDTDEAICNEVLVAQLPSYLPPEVVQGLLKAFRRMMEVRSGMPSDSKDSRSNLDSPPLHLGAWQKYWNALNLTGDTRAGDELVQEAVDAFLCEVEKAAAIMAPVMEEMFPRLMAKLRRYVFLYCLNIFPSHPLI